LNAVTAEAVSFRSNRLPPFLLPCRVDVRRQPFQINIAQIEEIFPVGQRLRNESDEDLCLVAVGAFRERVLLLSSRGDDPGAGIEFRDLLVADVGRAREIDEHRPVALGHHPHAR
jgi:hypothetical protein